MARTIVLNYDGEVSELGIVRVRRDKLYGRKVKMIVDEEGNPTQSAYLTRDGSALLHSGAMAMLYVDEDYDVTERKELIAVTPEGEELERKESTLGVEQELKGPVDPFRVLDHLTRAVYELTPEQLGEKLQQALDDGKIFETRFNYRRSFDDHPAFILGNEEAYFAVVGEPAEFSFLRREQVPSLEDDADDEDPFEGGELDFSMF